jgi:hypothetical protein
LILLTNTNPDKKVVGVSIGEQKKIILEGSTKKRINHKDYQLSTALNKKKKWYSCVTKVGASSDVKEKYSSVTEKK